MYIVYVYMWVCWRKLKITFLINTNGRINKSAWPKIRVDHNDDDDDDENMNDNNI